MIKPSSGAVLPAIGITIAAFSAGFGICWFNLDTVGACVDLAGSWVGKFKAMGDHIIAWGMSLIQSVKR